MTLRTSQCVASNVKWKALLTLLTAGICRERFAFVNGGDLMVKIPFFQQQEKTTRTHSVRLAHQQVRAHRRAETEATSGNENIPLGLLALSESQLGVGLGTHYAEIYLGIPPQRASVILDTGSHYTALPCSSCHECGTHTDGLFNVSRSTTAKYIKCHEYQTCRSCENDRCIISQSYVEGSMWQAEMVEELVWVGGYSSSNDAMEGLLKTFGFLYPLGCQTKETGLFITQKENGIMGLGRHPSSILTYMVKAGRVSRNLFTLCFTLDGGELVFGGVDYSHHISDVGYTPLLHDKSYYYPVYVKDIRIDGRSIGIDTATLNSGSGVIVDSGTTDTFFDANGNRRFIKAFEIIAGREYSNKDMKLSLDELAALPVISIILSGMQGDGTDDVQLDVPAARYLTPSNKKGSYYGNIHFSERSGGVIGASVMVGFDVIFDTDKKRIGFAESNCGKISANLSSTTIPLVLNTTNQSVVPTGLNVSQQPSFDEISSTGSSDDTINDVNSTISINALDDIDVSNGTAASTHGSTTSLKVGAFLVEILVISLVGMALAVLVWTKWRTRSWSRIPNATTTLRSHVETQLDDDDTKSLLPLEHPLSPRSRASRKAIPTTFTIDFLESKDTCEYLEGQKDIGTLKCQETLNLT
ncbi:Aspartyl protease [Plasmopara halstedii]|uniref:Aspartyl protease n=1 Tax=Plasmopara halstedii TaxID=4781 RepID=A0A0P1B4G0_PLAHL|nr:Aspartyl protease [Plasmopara halstedii]CEG49198.1 Aspartyl protease [Plasmopara halstedii]|eukprot:XP_024585567.1 Aspartyl protease [Plasmopara halstedii]